MSKRDMKFITGEMKRLANDAMAQYEKDMKTRGFATGGIVEDPGLIIVGEPIDIDDHIVEIITGRRNESVEPIPNVKVTWGVEPMPAVEMSVGYGDRENTLALQAEGDNELERLHFIYDIEARIYRTQAGGVTRIVTVLANGKGLAKLDGLKVVIGGRMVYDFKGHWTLRPGGGLCAAWYAGQGGEEAYWRDRSKSSARKGIPQNYRDQIKKRDAAMVAETKGNIGPFRIGNPYNKDGSSGGADFGIGIASNEASQCAEGAALLAMHFGRMFQRSPVFIMGIDGEPQWQSHPQGFAYGFDTPDGYDWSRDEARAWWPDADRVDAYTKPDDQHGGRLRIPMWLAEIDPFLMWCSKHNLNFWKLQYRYDANRSRDIDNGLRWDIVQHLEHPEGVQSGEPYPHLGRAFAHALNVFLDHHPHGYITRRMIEMLIRAYGDDNVWPHGDDGGYPDNNAYGRWMTTDDGGPWHPKMKRTMLHETLMLLEVMKRVPQLDDLRKRTEAMLRDAFIPRRQNLRKGINVETNQRTGNVMDYAELYFGETGKYGDTPQGVWDVAARRDPLGSDNPALSFPSEYWSEA